MSFNATVKRAWRKNHLLSVLVELTYACNLDCVFCYNDLSLEGTPLTTAQYKRFFDDLVKLGVLNLTLSGGEPLAHPAFYELGAYAKQCGFVVRIKSNGHAIRPSIAQRLRDEIDPFSVEVSLHGATAATHDQQTRVPGSFDRLLRNLRAMRDVGLRIKINSVLTSWNEHEVEGMYAICDDLGIKLQVDTDVKPKDDGDRAPLALAPSERGIDTLEQLLRDRVRNQASGGEKAIVPTVDTQIDARREIMDGVDKHCGAGSSTVAVDPFGNVLPCVQWRVPVGNLHRDSILDLWRASPVLEEVRSTTQEVHRWLASMGDTAALSNFCPGAAHTHVGDAFHLYPAAEARMKRASRERVHLRVL